MLKIVHLGNKTGKISPDTGMTPDHVSEHSVITTDSFDESLRYLIEENADILLVDRDFSAIRPEELPRVRGAGFHPVCIIWPPDEDVDLIKSSFISSDIKKDPEKPSSAEPQSSHDLIWKKNQELAERVDALEAVVRSLLTALSHYDLAYEAYTGDDAWQLIMKGIPSVDRIPDVFPDDDESEEDGEYFDPTDGN